MSKPTWSATSMRWIKLRMLSEGLMALASWSSKRAAKLSTPTCMAVADLAWPAGLGLVSLVVSKSFMIQPYHVGRNGGKYHVFGLTITYGYAWRPTTTLLGSQSPVFIRLRTEH